MSSRAIVITRPWQQARDLVQALQNQVPGVRLHALPLFEIAALDDLRQLYQYQQRLADYALLAFVSPNAIDAWFSSLQTNPAAPQLPPQLAISVMGEGSRLKLLQWQSVLKDNTVFAPSNPHQTDSETLLHDLQKLDWQGKRVLIVRGDSGRELLANGLQALGAVVDTVVAYQRLKPVWDSSRKQVLRDLLEQENLWVITSSEALRNLHEGLTLLQIPDLVAKLQKQRMIMPHSRIAETAQALGFNQTRLTASGDAALLQALVSEL